MPILIKDGKQVDTSKLKKEPVKQQQAANGNNNQVEQTQVTDNINQEPETQTQGQQTPKGNSLPLSLGFNRGQGNGLQLSVDKDDFIEKYQDVFTKLDNQLQQAYENTSLTPPVQLSEDLERGLFEVAQREEENFENYKAEVREKQYDTAQKFDNSTLFQMFQGVQSAKGIGSAYLQDNMASVNEDKEANKKYRRPIALQDKHTAQRLYERFHTGEDIAGLDDFKQLVFDGQINDFNIHLFTNNKNFTKQQHEVFKQAYKQEKEKKKDYQINQIEEEISKVKKNPNIPQANKNAIIHTYNKAIEELNKPDRTGGIWQTIWKTMQGFGQTVADRDFWTIGITEFARNKKYSNAAVQFDNNYKSLKKQGYSDEQADIKAFEMLSDKHKAIIEAFSTLMAAQEQRKYDTSLAYLSGETIAEMFPFMAQTSSGTALMRIMNGLIKAARTGQKLGKGTQFIKNAYQLGKSVENVGGGTISGAGQTTRQTGKQVVKELGKQAALDVERTAVITGISPTTYGNYFKDKGDNLVAHEDWTTKKKLKSTGQSSLENLSEFGLDKWIKLANKGLDNVALRIFGSKFSDLPIFKVFDNKFYRTFSDISGVRGGIGEGFEEYYNQGLTVGLGYALNDEELKNSWKDFMKKDSQIVLWGSILPATTFFGLAGRGANTLYQNQNSKAYRKAKDNLLQAMGKIGLDGQRITDITEGLIATGQLNAAAQTEQ